MQSGAKSVQSYLKELPEDRRRALEAVREVILANKHPDVEEGMQYGMIGYYVPHRVFPAGYHCDPKQPLPYAGLASQKGHMSLYLMCCYGHAGTDTWFRDAWAKTGKKLDMGKACIRFKKLEDVALDVIAGAIQRVTPAIYIDFYQKTLAGTKAGSKAAKKDSKASATPPAKKAAKVAKKVTAQKSQTAKVTKAGAKKLAARVTKKKSRKTT